LANIREGIKRDGRIEVHKNKALKARMFFSSQGPRRTGPEGAFTALYEKTWKRILAGAGTTGR